jgi:hypothetical protein
MLNYTPHYRRFGANVTVAFVQVTYLVIRPLTEQLFIGEQVGTSLMPYQF